MSISVNCRKQLQDFPTNDDAIEVDTDTYEDSSDSEAHVTSSSKFDKQIVERSTLLSALHSASHERDLSANTTSV